MNDAASDLYICCFCEAAMREESIGSHSSFHGFPKVAINEDNHFIYPITEYGASIQKGSVLPNDENTDPNGATSSKSTGRSNATHTTAKCAASPEELLIAEIQARPALWNISEKKLLVRREKNGVKRLWEEVYEALKEHYTSVEDVKRKWKNLHDTFKKYLLSSKQCKSGAAAPKKIKWQYFDQMSFLINVDIGYNSITESNIDLDAENIAQSDDEDLKISEPERIEKRNSKNKKTDILEKIAESLKTPPPPLQFPPMPQIPCPPPPSAPLNVSEDVDGIKAFAILVEKTLRKVSEPKASYVMVKLHELLYTLCNNTVE